MTKENEINPDQESEPSSTYVPPTKISLINIINNGIEEVSGGDPKIKRKLLFKLNTITRMYFQTRKEEPDVVDTNQSDSDS